MAFSSLRRMAALYPSHCALAAGLLAAFSMASISTPAHALAGWKAPVEPANAAALTEISLKNIELRGSPNTAARPNSAAVGAAPGVISGTHPFTAMRPQLAIAFSGTSAARPSNAATGVISGAHPFTAMRPQLAMAFSGTSAARPSSAATGVISGTHSFTVQRPQPDFAYRGAAAASPEARGFGVRMASTATTARALPSSAIASEAGGLGVSSAKVNAHSERK